MAQRTVPLHVVAHGVLVLPGKLRGVREDTQNERVYIVVHGKLVVQRPSQFVFGRGPQAPGTPYGGRNS